MTNASSEVVFGRRPDVTGIEHCSQCGGWIVGGASYISNGKRYCPRCMFDDTGKFVDSMCFRVRYWGPTAEKVRTRCCGQ